MMDMTRSESRAPRPPAPLHSLTTNQRRILEAIAGYCRATGEPCSAGYLARRFAKDPSTIREHLHVLYRRGWLRTPNSPSTLQHSID
jgi:hypothetical protein